MAMFLIDTNVMLAASAISELSNVATRAMPREIELRESVYEWLRPGWTEPGERVETPRLVLVRGAS